MKQHAHSDFFRNDLASLPAYVPGAPAQDDSVIKVASNEIPFPTLTGVEAVLSAGIGELNRYPDMASTKLREAIAAYHKVSIDSVTVSNGSTALIEKFLDAVCEPGTDVVLPWRSFEAYPIAIQVAGARPVKVPLRDDGAPDLRAMVSAITPETRAIVVCSPNNPSSGASTHAEMLAFLRDVPANIPVLLDEAYRDFAVMDDPIRGVELVAQFPNLISLRTFSKAYGLAALRIGYAISSPSIARGLAAVATPFGVNTLAQKAAVAALQQRPEVDRRVDIITANRSKLVSALRALGWDGPEPQANFVWFETGDRTAEFNALCLAEGIIVRAFDGEGVRVSVAEPEASLRLVRAYEKFRAAN